MFKDLTASMARAILVLQVAPAILIGCVSWTPDIYNSIDPPSFNCIDEEYHENSIENIPD